MQESKMETIFTSVLFSSCIPFKFVTIYSGKSWSLQSPSIILRLNLGDQWLHGNNFG